MDDLADRLIEFSRSGIPRGADSVWDAALKQLRRRHLARTTAVAVTAVGLVTVVAAVIAAIAVHDQRPPAAHATAPTTAHTAPNPPEQAAIALGRRMVAEVVLPAGSKPFTGPAPAGLHAPLEFPGTRNLVFAHRLWIVNETPYELWHFVQAHVPFPGQVGVGTAGNVGTWTFDDDLAFTPQNISMGSLQLEIAGNAAGPAVIRADTVVQWTTPRPTEEFVPPTDRTVTVSVVHISLANPTTGPIGKRVSTSDPKLVQPIVRTFNELHVTPPPAPNPGGGPCNGTVVYRVAFSASPTASPAILATVGICGGLAVTVNGRAARGLDDLPNEAFATDVAHVLGLAEPHFG